jgi:hypothetical protein
VAQLEVDSKHLWSMAVTKYGCVLFASANFFACLWWGQARFSGFPDT